MLAVHSFCYQTAVRNIFLFILKSVVYGLALALALAPTVALALNVVLGRGIIARHRVHGRRTISQYP